MIRLWLLGLTVFTMPTGAMAGEWSGTAGVVSDYRDRGLTLSEGRVAVQGSVLVESDAGLFAEAWGSTLGHELDTELDFSAGWAGDLGKTFSFEVYGTYIAYPADWQSSYFEATAALEVARGPVTLRGGLSAAPAQRGTSDDLGRKRGNIYGFTQASYELPSTPVTFNAGFGYENGAFDSVGDGGKWDWSVGAQVELTPARIGVSYTGSNADTNDRHALIGTLFLDW